MENKKETIEDATFKVKQDSYYAFSASKQVDYVTVANREVSAFIRGIEWAKERMFTEEDLRKAFSYYYGSVGETALEYDFKEWLIDFKKQ